MREKKKKKRVEEETRTARTTRTSKDHEDETEKQTMSKRARKSDTGLEPERLGANREAAKELGWKGSDGRCRTSARERLVSARVENEVENGVARE